VLDFARKDLFGYYDFALGAFGIDTTIKEGARKSIVDDWAKQRCAGEQLRWAYLFFTDLICKHEAEAWAFRNEPRVNVLPLRRSKNQRIAARLITFALRLFARPTTQSMS
jgi:hypothetical protein